MRSKKSARAKMTTRTTTSRARKPVARSISSWSISLVVCVIAAMVLIAARQPAPPAADTPAADIPIAKPPATVQKVPVTRSQASTKAAPASRTPAADPESKALVQESVAATITGCLERDGDAFRLKDTAGTELPTSRSWKSGFLKKGPASIEVVDAANNLSLSNHIGQRVSVSGALENRELQARSLRRVAASCDEQLTAKTRTS
jgi:hypothetical protein